LHLSKTIAFYSCLHYFNVSYKNIIKAAKVGSKIDFIKIFIKKPFLYLFVSFLSEKIKKRYKQIKNFLNKKTYVTF